MDDNRSAIARALANGHALREHGTEFANGSLGPVIDITDNSGNPDPNRLSAYIEDVFSRDDTRAFTSNGQPRVTTIYNEADNVIIILNPENSGDLGTVYRPDRGVDKFNDLFRAASRETPHAPPRVESGPGGVSKNIQRFEQGVFGNDSYRSTRQLIERKAAEIGEEVVRPQNRNTPTGSTEAPETTPRSWDLDDPDQKLMADIEARFGTVDADNVITDGNTLIAQTTSGETLTITKESGNYKIEIEDKFGQLTRHSIDTPRAATLLEAFGKRLGPAGGAALGVAAALTAFASGASAAEAGEILIDTAVPYGEAARHAANGDIRETAKAALSETAGTVGCVSGAVATGAAGAYFGAGVGSPTGPGALVTGLLGGTGGAIIGCIGGAIMASFASEIAFELIVPEDATNEEIINEYSDTILEHLPSEYNENMPPEMEALVEMKTKISQLEEGTEEYDQAMTEFKDFLSTDIDPQTAQQIITYIEFHHNRQQRGDELENSNSSTEQSKEAQLMTPNGP
jgi:hypothetical protein